ncbi:PH domain-containing protein [Helcococcus ovis]|uniref:PH domain-containing protein n=1 Tax=Helcococcus ovis TaxID=72026 RepID=A0A4R9C1Y0_9FIRM|nr:PH domain-containing protein [Helcococcus ovis]TFF65155.1 PH domain-containing protein [Helcococcus ovis]TFF66315.1 PH domain-containing protein [Helcococcus ovis]TFF67747.1 PH domain-containing protein [Helcococcus ovis]WNZ01396.1 PH domain-containing protein [Helcococcus ovis]
MVTNKRVYLILGIIGTDVQIIEYREIEKLNVNIGILEKMKNFI